MKETIYTIPINEAFDCPDGCPVCALGRKLEDDSLEYVLGAAMMEPEVRIETNRKGFCPSHFSRMLGMQKRLSLALIIESRLAELVSDPLVIMGGESCYVCNRVNGFMDSYCRNIVYLWSSSDEFRAKLEGREYICLPHLGRLLSAAKQDLGRKPFAKFADGVGRHASEQAAALRESVSVFCKSFDHRYSGIDLGDNKFAVERAIRYLSGDKLIPECSE